MKFKKIITSGCSFSDSETIYTWPNVLEKYIKNIYHDVSFDHKGLGHQGQELIQKKAIFAAMDAMEKGYHPDNIAIFVMWSGLDRKSWYITNPDIIDTITKHWKISGSAWNVQFCNLEGDTGQTVDLPVYVGRNTRDSRTKQLGYSIARYNPNGGWYHSSWTHNEPNFLKDYFTFDKLIDNCININCLHLSLENMIMLQNFCKSYGITLIQQYYMSSVYQQLDKFKDHKLLSYLYKQLDNNRIFPGQYEFVGASRQDSSQHPTAEGHQYYFDNLLLPFMTNRGFFNE